jgi:hypothetical protein
MRYHLPFLCILLSASMATLGQDTTPNLSYSIVAKKNHQVVRYKPGTHLCVLYRSDASTLRARGFYEGVINGQIVIAKKKNGVRVLIPVEDLTLLRKIAPGKRIVLGAMGTGMIAGGAALMDKGDPHRNGMSNAMLIPVIGVGAYLVLATPISLLIEKASEKRQRNGWSFQLEGLPPRR